MAVHKMWCILDKYRNIKNFKTFTKSGFPVLVCAFVRRQDAKETMFFIYANPDEHYEEFWKSMKKRGYTCERLDVEFPDAK